jgi:predicted RNA binding protein YcfA (HicA-like mRNA interferase family)
MPRAPRITATEMVRVLRLQGWYEVADDGSHRKVEHASKPGYVTVPYHTGVILKPKTLASILRQAGMTVDELRDLL